mgnify:CR=1 FL=1
MKNLNFYDPRIVSTIPVTVLFDGGKTKLDVPVFDLNSLLEKTLPAI